MVDPTASASGWNPGDGPLNPEEAAPLAISCSAESIYAYIPDYLEFDFPLDQVGPVPAAPAATSRTLLAQNPDGSRLYQLSNGQYQLSQIVDGEEQLLTLGEASQTGGTLLTEGATGSRLYHLSTGEFQVNMQHGGEEYVFTFDGCPATVATTRVYNASTWELLAEYTRTF